MMNLKLITKMLQRLTNKNIILGISGGIAAYKSVILLRLLIKSGANVRIVVTKNALEFVTRVTLETLSKNKVYSEVFAEGNDYTTEHVSLTDWGDLFIVAPATANIIGKYASGIADDALSTSLIAFDKKVLIAPAMNSKMYDNFAVQKNISYLKKNNISFIDAPFGELACGYDGKGRMAEPEDIYKELCYCISYKRNGKLSGKNILVTAGRTEEALDPVRFLTNRSSGKMGFRIAEVFAESGCNVTLITGPSSEKAYNCIKRIDIVSASEMYEKVIEEYDSCDIAVMAAAVADYSFIYSDKKIKKENSGKIFHPERTKDIAKDIGILKKDKKKIHIGFAMETDNEVENAVRKLKEKNFDFIILNLLNKEKSPFRSDNNDVKIINESGVYDSCESSKYEIANVIKKHCISLI